MRLHRDELGVPVGSEAVAVDVAAAELDRLLVGRGHVAREVAIARELWARFARSDGAQKPPMGIIAR